MKYCPFTSMVEPCGESCPLFLNDSCVFKVIAEELARISTEVALIEKTLEALGEH